MQARWYDPIFVPPLRAVNWFLRKLTAWLERGRKPW